MAKKLPAFQFYPGDWMKDPALRSVSLSARGLWMDLLCLMHESSRRGYLQHATGNPWTLEQIARVTGCATDEASRLLQELEDSGVFSRTEHSVIYSRRIVKDERKRQACKESGKKGGNPILKTKGLPPTLKGSLNGGHNGRDNPNPTPSSSDNSSEVSSERDARARGDSDPPQVQCKSVVDSFSGPSDDFESELPPEREWTMGERFILKACQLWGKPIVETNWKLRQDVQDLGKWVEERVDPKQQKGGRPEWFQEFWFQVLKRAIAPRPEYLIEQWDAYDRWLIENYETHRQGARA